MRTKDDEEFQERLLRGMKARCMTAPAVAREFGVSITTVERWMTGASAPHPEMRPHIFKFFTALSTTG